MSRTVGGCSRILEDVQECWRMLKKARGHWSKLKDVSYVRRQRTMSTDFKECWGMLQDVSACWRRSKDAGGCKRMLGIIKKSLRILKDPEWSWGLQEDVERGWKKTNISLYLFISLFFVFLGAKFLFSVRCNFVSFMLYFFFPFGGGRGKKSLFLSFSLFLYSEEQNFCFL